MEEETLEFDYPVAILKLGYLEILKHCNSIPRGPYWNNDSYRDKRKEFPGVHIGIMLFIEVENL